MANQKFTIFQKFLYARFLKYYITKGAVWKIGEVYSILCSFTLAGLPFLRNRKKAMIAIIIRIVITNAIMYGVWDVVVVAVVVVVVVVGADVAAGVGVNVGCASGVTDVVGVNIGCASGVTDDDTDGVAVAD